MNNPPAPPDRPEMPPPNSFTLDEWERQEKRWKELGYIGTTGDKILTLITEVRELRKSVSASLGREQALTADATRYVTWRNCVVGGFEEIAAKVFVDPGAPPSACEILVRVPMDLYEDMMQEDRPAPT